MGVLARAARLVRVGLPSNRALKKASREAQERQEERFREPETRKDWGFKGETPEEQRRLDEKREGQLQAPDSTQIEGQTPTPGDSESKG